MKRSSKPSTSAPNLPSTPLPLSDAQKFKEFMDYVSKTNPASHNFEKEFDKNFIEFQKNIGIAEDKRINLASFALVYSNLPSEAKVKFSDISLEGIKKYLELDHVGIWGQLGSFKGGLDPFEDHFIGDKNRLAIMPKFIVPRGIPLGESVVCQNPENTSYVRSYLGGLAVGATAEMERKAKSPFLVPRLSEVQKIINALSKPDGFQIKRFTPDCAQPPFSDAGHMAFGLAADQRLAGKHLGVHFTGEGLNFFYGTKSILLNRVLLHETLHSLFPNHVDEQFPQLLPLLQAENDEIPMSIMGKLLPANKWFDDRTGLIDLILIKLTQHLSIESGGLEQFAKYKNCTEDVTEFLKRLKEYNCTEIAPSSQIKSGISDSTMPPLLTSKPDSALDQSTTSLSQTDSVFSTTPAPTKDPASVSLNLNSLSDKIMLPLSIEAGAIFLGFLSRIMLLKSEDLKGEDKDAISSLTETTSRISGIGIIFGKEAVLQTLALPLLVTTLKMIEAGGEKMGYTPPSELINKSVEALIGSQAQDRISEIYKNTPEYAKSMAKQFAFVSAIYFFGNLIADDKENRLSYSESLMLSSITALGSSALRESFNFIEKKIESFLQNPQQVEGANRQASADIVLSQSPTSAPAQTSITAPESPLSRV